MTEVVSVWWRDDDAGRQTPEFDALLSLAQRTKRPLALAVVPAWLDPRVTAGILATRDVHVLQHGWDHADHAPAGSKRLELGGRLSAEACRRNLRQGKAVLERAFGERFLPVLVPPWNRIEAPCLSVLTELGFAAVSGFADDRRAVGCGLAQVNTHVDVIDWRAGRRMKSEARIRAEIDALLARPALGTIGVLSHHLVMTPRDLAGLAAIFAYLEGLLPCRWASARQVFACD